MKRNGTVQSRAFISMVVLSPVVTQAFLLFIFVAWYGVTNLFGLQPRFSAAEYLGRDRLLNALRQPEKKSSAANNPFEDVLVTLLLPHSDVHVSDGKGQDDKFFALPILQRKGKDCVVYAAGLAGEARFEMMLSNLTSCEVHGFDCTLRTKQPEWKFSFHDWCLGKERSFESNTYSKDKTSTGESFVFKSLSDVRRDLGHSHIDLLKFDIEGFEWELLDSLLQSDDSDLPSEILFELHTEGANPVFVPSSVVSGKSRTAVNILFLRLFDRGYRVTNVEINNGDSRCAEFALMRNA